MLCTMNYTCIGLLNPVEEKYEVMRPESVFLWRRVLFTFLSTIHEVLYVAPKFAGTAATPS